MKAGIGKQQVPAGQLQFHLFEDLEKQGRERSVVLQYMQMPFRLPRCMPGRQMAQPTARLTRRKGRFLPLGRSPAVDLGETRVPLSCLQPGQLRFQPLPPRMQIAELQAIPVKTGGIFQKIRLLWKPTCRLLVLGIPPAPNLSPVRFTRSNWLARIGAWLPAANLCACATNAAGEPDTKAWQ